MDFLIRLFKNIFIISIMFGLVCLGSAGLTFILFEFGAIGILVTMILLIGLLVTISEKKK